MIVDLGTRKLQKIRYSYLLPLPVIWIRNMQVVKGGRLSIEMQEDNSLRITPVPQIRQDANETGSSHLPSERGDGSNEFYY